MSYRAQSLVACEKLNSSGLFSLCVTDVCVCVHMCVHLGESSTRATTAHAVEQEHTKSVWKSSLSAKSVGVPSSSSSYSSSEMLLQQRHLLPLVINLFIHSSVSLGVVTLNYDNLQSLCRVLQLKKLVVPRNFDSKNSD